MAGGIKIKGLEMAGSKHHGAIKRLISRKRI